MPEDTWEDTSDWEQQEMLLIKSSSSALALHLDPPERKKKSLRYLRKKDGERLASPIKLITTRRE